MIYSAEEFVRLRDSTEKDEYDRASMDEAEVSVWLDVIDRYPEYRRWVAYNKTVPLDVLVCCVSLMRTFDDLLRPRGSCLLSYLSGFQETQVP